MKNISLILLVLVVMISCIKTSPEKKQENQQIISSEKVENTSFFEITEDNIFMGQDNILVDNYLEKYENISGIYYVYTFEIISKEGIYNVNDILNVMEFDNVTENNIVGNDKVFIEIMNIINYSYLLNYNLPFFGSRRPDSNNFRFQVPIPENNLIRNLAAEKGGGGVYVDFYIIDDYLLLNFLYDQTIFEYDEENEDLIPYRREELKCEFIFRKSENVM
jgi:hypothetical protein